MRQHFEISHITKYDKILTRDMSEIQQRKICYSCEKGFCRRKGRGKAQRVINRPGRFICLKCVNALLSGQRNNRTHVEFIDANSKLPKGGEISTSF